MDIQKLAEQIFKECEKDGEPVTMEDALEMAKYEIGAKDVKLYAHAEVEEKKQRKPKNVIVSNEKQELFQTILKNLDRCDGVERKNIEVLKENKLICVKIGEKTFKIDIIEQRPPKV